MVPRDCEHLRVAANPVGTGHKDGVREGQAFELWVWGLVLGSSGLQGPNDLNPKPLNANKPKSTQA